MEENRKQKLIAVTARAPYPLNSGGRIATYNTLRSLHKKYNIKLYIITDEEIDKNVTSHLENEFGSVFLCKKSKLVSYFDSLRFLISGQPMQLGYFYSKKLKKIIEKENNLNSDYFIGFVLRTAIYGQKFKSKRFIYSIDSMYLNYKNSVRNTKNILWKSIYKFESLLLEKFESTMVRNFDKISYVNPNEAEFWNRHGNVQCIPHGFSSVNNPNININPDFKNSIVFIGRMDYMPNIIAIEWFIKNVFEYLPDKVDFIIIGGNASKNLINKFSNTRIRFLGFIKNPDTIIKSSLCSIAPMLTGGGLQTKILKSFSLGSVVIMSELASKPILDFINHKHGFIAKSPKIYIEIINDLFSNINDYSYVKENAIELFENNYENSKIEYKIHNFFV